MKIKHMTRTKMTRWRPKVPTTKMALGIKYPVYLFSIACIFNCLVSSTTTKIQRLFVIPFLIWPLKVNGCLDDLKKMGSLKCVECIEN